MVEPVSAEQMQKNVAQLEYLFLDADIDTDFIEPYERTSYSDKIVRMAVETVARYGNKVTIDEIIEAEELEPFDDRYESNMVRLLTLIHALWVDKEAIINRPDNLLAVKADAEDWENGFRTSMANYVIAKGTYVNFHSNIYRWMDTNDTEHAKKRPRVVAAFNLKADRWKRFDGTFTGSTMLNGHTITVMHRDGVFRHLRMEGELGEIIRDITRIAKTDD